MTTTTMIARTPDWPAQLSKYIVSAQLQPFDYGAHDCCTFVAGAVKAMTGHDYMSEFRNSYGTEDEAEASLKTIGRGTLRKTLEEKFEKIPAAWGHKGDIAYFEGAIGIIIGRQALFIGTKGYRMLMITEIEHAYKVARA